MHAANFSLFDHLVGAAEQCRRHSPSEGFRCLEVDHQFKPCRLFNRQLSGFDAFEDLRCDPPTCTNSLWKYIVGIRLRIASATSLLQRC